MTVSTMYDTSMDVKIFTFDLAGKCAIVMGWVWVGGGGPKDFSV